MDSDNLNECDILPMLGINNDFQKIYNEFDSNPTEHLTIHKLVTLINLQPGKHRLFPNVGLREDFLNIPNTDLSLVPTYLNKIEAKIKDQIGLSTTLSFKVVNDENTQNSHIEITVHINSLPSKVLVTVQDKTKNVSERISTKYLNY